MIGSVLCLTFLIFLVMVLVTSVTHFGKEPLDVHIANKRFKFVTNLTKYYRQHAVLNQVCVYVGKRELYLRSDHN